MKIIKINKNNIKKDDLKTVIDFLNKGQTIVYPTDTVYGLGCLATDKKAINKIRKIKQRDKKKPFLVLVSDFKMLNKYFVVDKKQLACLHKIWPGPISAILRQKGLFPKELTGGFSDVAVRLPKNNFLVKMIGVADVPIVSTSLNLSGQAHLDNVSGIEKYFKINCPDLIIDRGELKGQPSILIDLRDAEDIKILRK